MSRVVNRNSIETRYHEYIELLNERGFSHLFEYVAASVVHNDRTLDLERYSALIPLGALFRVDGLVVDAERRTIASRLHIEVALITGRGRSIDEHAFYQLDNEGRISQVWSMLRETA